jgi:hypothetical protein
MPRWIIYAGTNFPLGIVTLIAAVYSAMKLYTAYCRRRRDAACPKDEVDQQD